MKGEDKLEGELEGEPALSTRDRIERNRERKTTVLARPEHFHFNIKHIKPRKARLALSDVRAYQRRTRERDLRGRRPLDAALDYVKRELDFTAAQAEVGYHTVWLNGYAGLSEELFADIDRMARTKAGAYKNNGGHAPRLGSFITGSIPYGVTLEQSKAALDLFLVGLGKEFGVASEAVIHLKKGQPDHFHAVVTDRIVSAAGVGVKQRRFNAVAQKAQGAGVTVNDKLLCEATVLMRDTWATLMSEVSGREISARSFAARGLGYEPVKHWARREIMDQEREGRQDWRAERAAELAAREQSLEARAKLLNPKPAKRRDRRAAAMLRSAIALEATRPKIIPPLSGPFSRPGSRVLSQVHRASEAHAPIICQTSLDTAPTTTTLQNVTKAIIPENHSELSNDHGASYRERLNERRKRKRRQAAVRAASALERIEAEAAERCNHERKSGSSHLLARVSDVETLVLDVGPSILKAMSSKPDKLRSADDIDRGHLRHDSPLTAPTQMRNRKRRRCRAATGILAQYAIGHLPSGTTSLHAFDGRADRFDEMMVYAHAPRLDPNIPIQSTRTPSAAKTSNQETLTSSPPAVYDNDVSLSAPANTSGTKKSNGLEGSSRFPVAGNRAADNSDFVMNAGANYTLPVFTGEHAVMAPVRPMESGEEATVGEPEPIEAKVQGTSLNTMAIPPQAAPRHPRTPGPSAVNLAARYCVAIMRKGPLTSEVKGLFAIAVALSLPELEGELRFLLATGSSQDHKDWMKTSSTLALAQSLGYEVLVAAILEYRGRADPSPQKDEDQGLGESTSRGPTQKDGGSHL